MLIMDRKGLTSDLKDIPDGIEDIYEKRFHRLIEQILDDENALVLTGSRYLKCGETQYTFIAVSVSRRTLSYFSFISSGYDVHENRILFIRESSDTPKIYNSSIYFEGEEFCLGRPFRVDELRELIIAFDMMFKNQKTYKTISKIE